VEIATAKHMSMRDGQTYYFCSAGCKQSFDEEPGRYLTVPDAVT